MERLLQNDPRNEATILSKTKYKQFSIGVAED